MKKLMSLLSRRELLCSITQRYRAAGRKDKQRILDEFVEATGYHHIKRMISAMWSRRTAQWSDGWSVMIVMKAVLLASS